VHARTHKANSKTRHILQSEQDFFERCKYQIDGCIGEVIREFRWEVKLSIKRRETKRRKIEKLKMEQQPPPLTTPVIQPVNLLNIS
jgi:hypothetical protein